MSTHFLGSIFLGAGGSSDALTYEDPDGEILIPPICLECDITYYPAAYAEGYEHFNLLESLEDLVDQLGRGKCSDEDVLEILNNIVNHEDADGWTIKQGRKHV